MKYLNNFNESWKPDEDRLSSFKSFTEDDKKFFDDVFAEFIDMGAKSELYDSKMTHYEGKGGSGRYEQLVKRYRIYVDLSSMNLKGKPLGGRLVDLVRYSESLNELVLELNSCVSKIKEEEDYKYIATYFYTNKNSKVKLNYGDYDEGEVPDRFNIVLDIRS